MQRWNLYDLRIGDRGPAQFHGLHGHFNPIKKSMTEIKSKCLIISKCRDGEYGSSVSYELAEHVNRSRT